MKRIFLCLIILSVSSVTLNAQKKPFTFDQLFGNNFPEVFRDLPEIDRWLDDEHYLEIRNNGDKDVLMSVEAKSGKAIPYVAPATSVPDVPVISEARNSTLSPDGKYVAFTRKNNLFVKEIASGKETAITNDGSDVILNGYASWIYYEEILGRSSNYRAFWWSPDSRHIAFMRFDDSAVPIFPIYFADGQYGYLEQQHYPKAGAKNPEVKIAISSVDGKSTAWADFNAKDDQYFGTPYWTPSNELFVQWMNREQDSLIVYNIDKSTGDRTPVYTETQATWITLDKADRFYFLPGKNSFIIESDKDGWHNLYLHDMSGKLLNRITNDNFWGTEILTVNEKAGTIYFKARKENSARFDVYKALLNGKGVTRLSFGNYSHEKVSISPSGKYFISTYSSLSEPPKMTLVDNKGKIIRELGSSKGPEFDAYALPVTKLITVKSSDGQFDLPVTITYPINFDSTKKYPVWVTVYGGPNAGTVYDRWKPSGGAFQLLAQEGLIQVSMDNRSSGHFGKKGINYIFKQMGKWEIEDYMACADWIRNQRWADSTRIGISGGSFGGYITCMALTYGADVFTHGIANYSVTDWRLYDSHYTERFMNTPESNEEGYRQTSVLTYVDRYKGKLRIVHGSTDDNVHMQNSIQLIDALQNQNKSFELMIYPNQRHGIQGSKVSHNFIETLNFIYEHMLGRKVNGQW